MADKEMTRAVGRMVAARGARDNAADAYRLARSVGERSASLLALSRAEKELDAATLEVGSRWGAILQEEASFRVIGEVRS